MGQGGRALNLLDLAVLVAAGALAGFVVYRLTAGMHYRFDWPLIFGYVVRQDPDTGRWTANLLLRGFAATIRLSVWSMLLATFMGTLMALCRISVRPLPQIIGRTYVGLVRNVPPLVLMFIGYFFIGDYLMSVLGVEDLVGAAPPWGRTLITVLFAPTGQLGVFLAAMITLALYEGAYITEIVRGGILAVDRGQWEASGALGLTRAQQLRHVILPQASRRILPPLAGQLISTIKDSAIVSVISIQELSFQGLEIMAATYRTIEIWTVITALYFVLTFSCSLFVRRLEMRMTRAWGGMA